MLIRGAETPLSQDTAGIELDAGLNIFKSWGPHVRQFAIAFEITEGKLHTSGFICNT